jgi:hypothetical protein
LKKIVAITALVLLTALGLAYWYFSDRGRWTTEADYTGLDRHFSEGALISPHDPSVSLQFDPAFEYLGGQKFVLYGVADAEQHFLVEKNSGGALNSLYWIQFEAYLPDNDYRYDYKDSPSRMQLDEMEFYLDSSFVDANPANRRRGSDGSLARQFLALKDLVLPQHFSYARLVYLTDPSRRKELMVIFIEDLGPGGLTAASLSEGGEHADRHDELMQQFLERIRQTMTVQAGPSGEPNT